MKYLLILASIIFVILGVIIIYLGLQRESIVNPPNITGVGFFVVAIVLFFLRKHIR